MRSVGLMILAAGGSTRLGRPKQLLEYQGRSLIVRAAQAALSSSCTPIAVVLGAYAQAIEREVCQLPVQVVENPDWRQGMGTSIKMGLHALAEAGGGKFPDTDGVMITLGDQPSVTGSLLDEMAEAFDMYGGIIASAYCNTLGAPVIFDRAFYSELASLAPGQGAKRVIDRHPEAVHAVDFPGGVIDIDTEEDYEQLKKGEELILFERPGMTWSEGAD